MGISGLQAIGLLVLIGGCTTHDPENGRVGGPVEDVHVDFPDAADSGISDGSSDTSDGEAPALVPFCEAFKVMKVCRRCHEPVPNRVGTPFALQTWEDTQQEYVGEPVWHHMISVLEVDFMPLRTLPIEIIDPPIQPLDPTCKNTLLTWLRQGAQPVGGTDCNRDLSCEGCPNFP
jgi:hypothetical protein